MITKVVDPNLFASFFVFVLYIGSWLLFCIAPNKVIALPTFATAIVVALLRFHTQYQNDKGTLFAIASNMLN